MYRMLRLKFNLVFICFFNCPREIYKTFWCCIKSLTVKSAIFLMSISKLTFSHKNEGKSRAESAEFEEPVKQYQYKNYRKKNKK